MDDELIQITNDNEEKMMMMMMMMIMMMMMMMMMIMMMMMNDQSPKSNLECLMSSTGLPSGHVKDNITYIIDTTYAIISSIQ